MLLQSGYRKLFYYPLKLVSQDIFKQRTRASCLLNPHHLKKSLLRLRQRASSEEVHSFWKKSNLDIDALGSLVLPATPSPAAKVSPLLRFLGPTLPPKLINMSEFVYTSGTQFTLSAIDGKGTVSGVIGKPCQLGRTGESQVVQVTLERKTGPAPAPLNATLIAKFYDPAYVLGEEDMQFSTTAQEKSNTLFNQEYYCYTQCLSKLSAGLKLAPAFHGAYLRDNKIKVILLEFFGPPEWKRLDECPKSMGQDLFDAVTKAMKTLQDGAGLCILDIGSRNIFVKLGAGNKVVAVVFVDFAHVESRPEPNQSWIMSDYDRRYKGSFVNLKCVFQDEQFIPS